MQTNAKRVLAYSSVAHTGYMLVALLIVPISGQAPLNDGTAALLLYIPFYGASNLAPFPGMEVTTTQPPCCAAMPKTVASPRPVPLP